MSRYFFNIRRGSNVVLDEEGEEYDSVEEAYANATRAVRELAAAQIKNGLTIPDEHMDVHDETGNLLLSVSFHALVQEHLKN